MQIVQTEEPAARTLYELPPVPPEYRKLKLLIKGIRDRAALYRRLVLDEGIVAQISPDTPHPYVLLKHPDAIEKYFKDEADVWRKPDIPLSRLVVGEGQLFSNDGLWKGQQRQSVPAFGGINHEKMVETMVAATNEALDRWQPTIKAGNPIDLTHEFPHLALDILIRSLFNRDSYKDTLKLQSALGTVLDMVSIYRMIPAKIKPSEEFIAGHWPFKGQSATLSNAAKEILTERRVDLLNNYDFSSVAHKSSAESLGEIWIRAQLMLLSLNLSHGDAPTQRQLQLLQNSAFTHKNDLLSVTATQGDFTETQREHQVASFLIAGHETTAHSMTFLFKLMTENPKVWENIKKEVAEVFGNEPVTIAGIRKLRYTPAAVAEDWRLYPPVAAVSREARRDHLMAIDDKQNILIKEGQTVFVAAWGTHCDPRYWEKPLKFIPERHLGENRKKIAPGSYFPFSHGERACTGRRFAELEILSVVATLAQRGTLRVENPEAVRAHAAITTRPKGKVMGYWVPN